MRKKGGNHPSKFTSNSNSITEDLISPLTTELTKRKSKGLERNPTHVENKRFEVVVGSISAVRGK